MVAHGLTVEILRLARSGDIYAELAMAVARERFRNSLASSFYARLALFQGWD